MTGRCNARLAQDCRRPKGERGVRSALNVISRIRLAVKDRPSRRLPWVWKLNVGGLDWPMVYNRAAALHMDRAASFPRFLAVTSRALDHPFNEDRVREVGETPRARGERLIDALLAWLTPARQLKRGFNRFEVRVSEAGDTWIKRRRW